MADIVSGVVGVGICFVVNIFYPVFAAELSYVFTAYFNERTDEFSLANRKYTAEPVFRILEAY